MNPSPIRSAARRRTALAAVFAACVVAACGGGAVGGDDDGGQVRLVNATLENASLDLKADSDTVVSGVGALDASDYENVDAGDHTFRVVANGATAASTSNTVGDGGRYTAVASSSSGTTAVTWLTEDEDDADAGNAKLRVLHTDSANVGAVDVFLITAACSTLASASNAAIATGVSGLQSGWSEVSAASGGTPYHLCITAAGDRSDVRLEIPALTLASKEVVTVVLARSSGGVLLNGLVLPQRGSVTKALNTFARVRVAAGTSGGAAVTATANGTPLGVSLPPGGVGTYKLVSAGDLTLGLTVGGTATTPSGLAAAAGSDVTLLVTGTASSATVTPILDDNNVSTSTGKPVKVRLVNGMAGSGTALLTVDFNVVGDGAAFPGASAYSQVAASAGLARVEVTGSSTLCLSTAVTLLSGSVYSVFVLGDVPTTVPACTLRLDR